MYKVIIADDEALLKRRLVSTIQWERYDTEIAALASDGREAYDLCLLHKPDILITDIRMPEISGLELAKMLQEAGLNTKVIIISGYADFNYAKEALKYGVVDYVTKPIKEAELIENVQACIRLLEREEKQLRLETFFGDSQEERELFLGSDSTLQKILKYIDRHYMEPITSKSVAEVFQFSPAYFSSYFSRNIGQPFSKYLLSYRLMTAQKLLLDSSMRINEVADKVGFNDIQYFNKAFKAMTGCSPKQFRESGGEINGFKREDEV